jgi:hypothetical protein
MREQEVLRALLRAAERKQRELQRVTEAAHA